MQVFLPFYWSRAHHVTYKELSTNNGLLMLNAVQLCFAANNILVMPRWIFLQSLLHENGRSLHFPKICVEIQLGDPMIVNIYWTRLSQNIVIDLLATNKSRYSRSTFSSNIIVNHLQKYKYNLIMDFLLLLFCICS